MEERLTVGNDGYIDVVKWEKLGLGKYEETQQSQTKDRLTMDSIFDAGSAPTKAQTKRRKGKAKDNITKAKSGATETTVWTDPDNWTGSGADIVSIRPMIEEIEKILAFVSKINGALDGVKFTVNLLEPHHNAKGIMRHGEARLAGWRLKSKPAPKGTKKGKTDVADALDSSYVDAHNIIQIGISGDAFNKSYWDVIQTAIHELAHVVNFALDVKDCSKSQVHNKKFAAAANTLGLAMPKTDNDKKSGQCKITDDIKQKIKDNVGINEEAFTMVQRVLAKNKKTTTRKNTSRLSYTCPMDNEKRDNCGLVTSHKQDLNILCGEHGEAYQVKA